MAYLIDGNGRIFTGEAIQYPNCIVLDSNESGDLAKVHELVAIPQKFRFVDIRNEVARPMTDDEQSLVENDLDALDRPQVREIVPLTADVVEQIITPTFERLDKISKELDQQTDRGVATLAVSLLEDVLKDAIKSRLFFLDKELTGCLFKGIGPFASLYNGTRVARALGLIGSNSFKELGTLGTIRNKVAHGILDDRDQLLSFETKDIATLCDNLWIPKQPEMFPPRFELSTRRKQFIHSVVTVYDLIRSESNDGRIRIQPSRLI